MATSTFQFGVTYLATASCILVATLFILGLRNDGWHGYMFPILVDSNEG